MVVDSAFTQGLTEHRKLVNNQNLTLRLLDNMEFHARTQKGYMNRQLWVSYMVELNKFAIRLGKKYLVICDCLSSHFTTSEKQAEWKNSTQGRDCFVDDSSYSNLKLCYLPSRVTAFCQPQDQGYYNYVQHRYRAWMNDRMILNSKPKKVEQVQKVFELLNNVPENIVKASWQKSAFKSFHFPDMACDTNGKLKLKL